MTRYLLGGASLAALAVANPAAAQSGRAHYVQPYIEVNQAVAADLTNDDVATYTSVAAGIDVGAPRGRRVEASYRYAALRLGRRRRGPGRAFRPRPRRADRRAGLNLEGGAIATRTQRHPRRGAGGNLVGDVANVAQIIRSAGRSYSGRVGALNLGASYSGYMKAETPDIPCRVRQRLDYFDDSTSYVAQATVGTAAGDILPVRRDAVGRLRAREGGSTRPEIRGRSRRRRRDAAAVGHVCGARRRGIREDRGDAARSVADCGGRAGARWYRPLRHRSEFAGPHRLRHRWAHLRRRNDLAAESAAPAAGQCGLALRRRDLLRHAQLCGEPKHGARRLRLRRDRDVRAAAARRPAGPADRVREPARSVRPAIRRLRVRLASRRGRQWHRRGA
ncbi:hypothetical protein AB5I41_15910 [Sphingomonas sp. MMS24-JH45]